MQQINTERGCLESFSQRIAKLSPQRLLLLTLQQQQRITELEEQSRESIAVIGMACRMPAAADPEAFWHLLECGACTVQEITEERLTHTGNSVDRALEAPARWGAFLENIADFDPSFFNLSPAEATAMDPQHRLLLEVTWEALERSCVPSDSLLDTKTGVFIGMSSNDYALLAQSSGVQDGNRYIVTGASNSIAVGRISYLLGLHGPNMAVDTSCSSSATSIHLALQSLRRGECDLALAGGVSLALLPSITETLARFNMLAIDGRCKPFSDAADGFGRGEGCGIVVLKRLKDALRDNDNVVGIIRGSACNSDGRSSGLTAPSGPAQESVIREALTDAGISADEIDWVEAHGTGTPLGDPIELTALGRVYREHANGQATLPVSSVKSNINHLEAAAGVAGLIKVLLSIEHEAVPGTLQSQPPNARFDWKQNRLTVSAKTAPWPRRDHPRRAGLSSFGFSGTNVHLVIEEPPSNQEATDEKLSSSQLITASAKTKAALKELCGRYAEYLEQNPNTRLDDFAASVNAGRTHFAHRLSAVAATTKEACRIYRTFSVAAAESTKNYSFIARNRPPHTTYIFREGEAVSSSLVRRLQQASPVFQKAFSECESTIAGRIPALLDAYDEGSEPARRVVEFAVLYALAHLVSACSGSPTALSCSGLGEIAAATFAQVMKVSNAVSLVFMSGFADQNERSAELLRWKAGVSLAPPTIPILREDGSQPERFDDADLWIRRDQKPAEPNEESSPREQSRGISLWSLLAGPSESSEGLDLWEPLLHQLATLYLGGSPITWSALPEIRSPRKLVVPTYPFQRERFWLELAPRGAAHGATGGTEERPQAQVEPRWHSWLYETVWRPIVIVNDQVTQARDTSAVQIMQSMRPLLDSLAAQTDYTYLARFRKDADDLSLQFIAQALRELNFKLEAGQRLGQDLCAALGVSPKHQRLLHRIFSILRDEGIVANEQGGGWIVQESVKTAIVEEELARMRSCYPQSSAEIDLFERGVHLGSILRGQKSGLELLFPNGSLTLAENLYQNSSHARLLNPLVAEVAKRSISALPTDRKLRVLEIGAGTGSTSALILPMLPPDRVEYVFSDLSKFFLTSAAKKFASYDFVRYALYDVEGEQPPAGENWESFDLVIAANVLHATKSLRHTLQQVRRLMAPGGFLLLLEAAKSQRLADITLGTIEGWWGYEDLDLRQSSVLIRPELWQSLMEEAGFSSALLPADADSFGGILADEAVILGRFDLASSTNSITRLNPSQSTVLMVGDRSQEAMHLGRLLHELGIETEQTTLAEFSVALTNVPGSNKKLTHVFFLQDDDADQAHVDLAEAAERISQMSLAIVQGLLQTSVVTPEIWFPVCNGQLQASYSNSPVAALLRGLLRVLETEHPRLQTHILEYDDLFASGDQIARIFVDERSDWPREIRICKGEAFAPALQPLKLRSVPALRFDSAGAYLVTGAFGVLGWKVAQWLAERGAGTLVLVGWHAASPQVVTQIEEVRRLGTQVILSTSDISVDHNVIELFKEIKHLGAPLRGVFHAAGVLDDVPILGLSPRTLARVLAPKVRGGWLLHQATIALPLDHFILFSSAVTVLGTRGQASYAMANSFLAWLATHRVAQGLPAVTIDWGPWVASGAQVKRDFLSSWKKAGGEPIEYAEGLEILEKIIGSKEPHVTVLPLEKSASISASLGSTCPQILRPLVSEHAPNNEATTERHISLRTRLKEMPATSHGEIVSRYIELRLIELLELDANASIGMETPFLELGVDSLVSLELTNELQDAIQVNLPSALFFEYPDRQRLDRFLNLVLQAQDLNQDAPIQISQGTDDFDEFIV